jgi:hypothetical protein
MKDPTEGRPGEANTYHHDVGGETHVSTSITEAIAEAEEVDPLEVPSPLESAVDADALDDLFEPRDGERLREHGLVRFPFEGHLVTVWADGTIVVERDAVE